MRISCPSRPCLRLRVIANSDADADQTLKLRVRDAALPAALARPLSISGIEAAAKAVDPSARAEYGRFTFGGYASRAVQITLGAGGGHNWWGVLYPNATGVPDEPVVFSSWIANLLRSWGWI